MTDKKRVNYTTEERKLLIELVEKHKTIIESKQTNAVSNAQKDSTWKMIERSFNGRSVNVYRDSNSLRKQWTNLKMETRKKAANQRKEMYKTGGGKIIEDKPDEGVLSLLSKKTVFGISNKFDSDEMLPESNEIEPVIEESNSPNQTVEENNSLEEEIMTQNLPKWSARKRPKLNLKSVEVIEESGSPNKTAKENNTLEEEITTNLPKWSARRRPKLNLKSVEKAKIEVLEAQRDVVLQELEYKKQLFEMEIEHKKLLNKLEIEHKMRIYEEELKKYRSN